MDFNLKSDLQEACLTLIVNSTVCLGRLAGLYWFRNGRKVDDLQFLVHWRDQPSANDSWEPDRNLACPDILQQYALDHELPSDVFAKRTNRLPV